MRIKAEKLRKNLDLTEATFHQLAVYEELLHERKGDVNIVTELTQMYQVL